jgi:hypothetical protein
MRVATSRRGNSGREGAPVRQPSLTFGARFSSEGRSDRSCGKVPCNCQPQRAEYIRDLQEPPALRRGLGEHLAHRGPEPRCGIVDGRDRGRRSRASSVGYRSTGTPPMRGCSSAACPSCAIQAHSVVGEQRRAMQPSYTERRSTFTERCRRVEERGIREHNGLLVLLGLVERESRCWKAQEVYRLGISRRQGNRALACG